MCRAIGSLFLIWAVAVFSPLSLAGELEDYVRLHDPSSGWEVVRHTETDAAEVFVVHLQSQSWRSSLEVNSPLWRHWLTVVRPKVLKSEVGFLFVGGGVRDEAPPLEIHERWMKMAVETGSVVAELRNVPNQPLAFVGDGKERFEDDLIASSWNQAMNTGDATWSLRFPMVKSVVKAMDVVDELINGNGTKLIRGYTVSGASKRGWVAWLTAAIDSRVQAVVPMVIDVLNAEKQLAHHLQSYGFWAPALQDYVSNGIMERTSTDAFRWLMSIEDPLSYRDHLPMPKLIVGASGDQFFLPDSSQFYFHQLQGKNYLRYLPNADHSMSESDVWDCARAFQSSIARNEMLPQFSWELAPDGALEVHLEDQPDVALLWQATNPAGRDFRREVIGQGFVATPLSLNASGVFRVPLTPPTQGASAYFVELTYGRGPALSPHKFTTDIFVVPAR